MFRYQVQGPRAGELLQELNGGPFDKPKFFHMGWITVAGHRMRILHHGMSGVEGAEIFGPAELGAKVKAAIMETGRKYGVRHVGSRAYATNTLESGWIPSPLPAVYIGDSLREYRQWLPATAYEGVGSLGDSFFSPNIEDYYLTPWDLGYGHILKFDHDFFGREALEKKANEPHRQKVTLVWNAEDVSRVMASWLGSGPAGKYIEMPLSQYATWMYDKVFNCNGEGGGPVDLLWLQLEQKGHALLGNHEPGILRPRHGGRVGVGRRGRRIPQAVGRAAQADGDSGHGGTGALRGAGTPVPRRGARRLMARHAALHLGA